MGIVFKNNAKTTLASSLSNSATSATVTDGSVFPSLSAGEFFLITFDDGTNNEICKCTARSGNTLTIVRAQESTTARAFSSGDSAEGRVTAGVLEQIQENIAAKSANQTVFNTTTAGGATTYNIGTNPGVEANAMVFLNGVLQHHDTLSFSGTNLTFDAAPPNGMALEVIIDNLINLQSSNLTVDSFTAADVSGSPQTDFTLSDTPAAETNLIVFVDGVFQDQDAYTISSNILSITTGVIAGRGVTVYVINPVNIGTPSDSTVTSAKLSGNITMPGNLIVGSNDVAFDSPTFVVDHTNSRVGMGIASPTVPVDIVGEVKTSSHINIGGNLVKASGDLTLDVAADIILDAGGNEIKLKTNGTEWGQLYNSSSDLAIYSAVQDKDIKLQGNDGGSVITALSLDMSEAGAATFNGKVGAGKTPSTWHLDVDSTDVYIASFDGSNDTGIVINSSSAIADIIGYSNSASTYNSVNIRGASGTGLVVNTSNNVGIGTTSPGRLFHVYGSATSTVAKFSNTGNVVYVELNAAGQAGADAGYFKYDNNKNMSFWTSDTERLIIDSLGRETNSYQPYTASYDNSNQSVSAVTWTDVAFDTDLETNGTSMRSGTTFTFPVAGVYLVTGVLSVESPNATNYNQFRAVFGSHSQVFLGINELIGSNTYGYDIPINFMVKVSANDTMKLQAFSGSGSLTLRGGAASSHIEVMLMR